MNKSELITAVAKGALLSKKDAERAVNALIDTVKDSLAKGEPVQLVGFGTFEVGNRAERTGKNPKTGESMVIPACKVPKFKAGKALKEVVK